MSQTKQQQLEAGADSPGRRRDGELFWRIIAALMVLVIAWVLWVLYQITPRSVVTPRAYANRTRPIRTQWPASGAAGPAATPAAIASPGPASATATAATAPPAATSSALPHAAAGAVVNKAQEAASSGAPQTSAEVQASAMKQTQQQTQGTGVGLRLATEITTPAAVSAPAAGKPGRVIIQRGASGGATAVGAAGK
jgi:hypothetical protein